MRIAVIPGSNRQGAKSRVLADLVAREYERLGHATDIVDLADMGPEFLDPQAYRQPAPAVTAMVERFLAADGVVFLVPEYNGSFPGVLKLYVDMLPYPAGLDGRPCAFVGLSAGQFKALRAVEALQLVTGYRNAYNYPRRIFIGNAGKAFDERGELVDPELRARLAEQAAGFVGFIRQLKG